MLFPRKISSPASSIKRKVQKVVAVGAVVGVSLLTATPAQAATSLETVVVKTGSSATISVGAIPAGATRVTLNFTGTGQWQDTDVSARLGPDGPKVLVLKAKANQKTVSTATLDVPS